MTYDLADVARHPPPWAGVTLWLAIVAVASIRGRGPERLAAGLLLADLVALTLFPDPPVRRVMHWRFLAGDLVVLAGLAWITLTSARSWTLWALGFQTVAVMTHAPRLLSPDIWTSSYMWLANGAGYLVVSALLAGALIEGGRDAGRRTG